MTDSKVLVRSASIVMLFDAQTLVPIEEVSHAVMEINGRRGTLRGRIRYTTFETRSRVARRTSPN